MTLDLVFASLALIMVYLGWRSGVTGQVLRVAAAIAVLLFTSPASTMLREALAPEQTVSSPGFEVASMFGAAVLLYIGVTLAGSLVIGAMRKVSDTLSAVDRIGGALLGTVKALLIVYVLAACALLLQGSLAKADPDDAMHLRDGYATALVEQHNVIAPWRFPALQQLQAALRVADAAAQRAEARGALKKHATAADFIRRERFQALLKRPALMEAARQGRYALVLADEQARAFLNDPEQVDALQKIDWTRVETDVGTAPVSAIVVKPES